MTKSGSPQSPGNSGSQRPVFGTQRADFGTPGQTAGTVEAAAGATPSKTGSGRFGTMMARPLSELAESGGGPPEGIPAREVCREISKTHRADGSALSALAQLAAARKNQEQDGGNRAAGNGMGVAGNSPKAAEPASPKSPPDMLAQRTMVTPAKATTAPGPAVDSTLPMAGSPAGGPGKPHRRSTWDLRIHKRHVAGHLSGVMNPDPASLNEATGLQSAFVIDASAPEYEVISQLGAGAMGIVYHARQLSLNRELAIKTLKPDTVHAEHDQAMFVSEAVVTANLVHPNIVPIHDLGRTKDGKLFYSMKCVTGVSWSEEICHKSLEDNLDILMKVCDAVAYAHSRGVINRDLKPENVVVGNYGEVVVLDWGLAITTDKFEKSKSVIIDYRGGSGTPAYMAPELLDEDISLIGPASDIYLLGAILFEILEGFPPHLLRRFWSVTDAEEMKDGVIWAVINNDIEDDVIHRGELMQIARKAMATSPSERYRSVEELQEAIREYRITGRAEELLNSVDLKQTTSYTGYQSAVALYSEALRKWPTNRRALNGDRKARIAYAQMAYRKGDFDLGLQVVAGQSDDDFRPLIRRLNRSRMVRTVIRATWMLTTVSAMALLLWGFIQLNRAVQAESVANIEKEKALNARNEAIEAKNEAERLKDDAIRDKQEIEQLAGDKKTLEAQKDSLQKTANLEIDRAKQAVQRANEKEAEAVAKEKELAATTEKLKDAQEENEKVLAETRTALIEAEQAKALLATAKMAAEKAVGEAQTAELNAFMSRIEAADKLGDFTQLIEIATEAIHKTDNPKIQKRKRTLEEMIRNATGAVGKGGNASVVIPGKPEVAAISADGNTTASIDKDGKLAVLWSDAGFVAGRHQAQQISTDLRNGVRLCLSSDGSLICATSPASRKLWKRQGSEYHPAELEQGEKSADGSIEWSFFSANGRHLYLVHNDDRATVEIYSAENGKLLIRQPLAGRAAPGFRLKDIVLLPDESSLIVQYSLIECYEYPIQWTGDVPSFGSKLANTAAKLQFFEIPTEIPVKEKPERLFVSPDGSLLALAVGETVIILPRLKNPGQKFSFGLASKDEKAAAFRCSFAVRDLCFSSDNQRIATGHGNRYIELWDRTGSSWAPCAEKDLFRHSPTKSRLSTGFAACLRGHSDMESAEIKALAFSSGNSDKLVSVSSDETIRSWQISEYSELVQTLSGLNESLRKAVDSGDAAALPGTGRRKETGSLRAKREDRARFSGYRFTGLPESRPQAATGPRRQRQGQGVFSARFSPDSRRLLIGADDLAAHVFDSETGRRVLSASMSGRKDLFFDPDRNNFLEGHISEISSVQFVPPNGDLLLTADYFGSISVWDASPGENGVGYEKSRLLSEYSFSEFAVSQDGSLVLAGGATTTNPEGSLQSADLKHMGVVWRTADILQSPNPAPYLLLENQHEDYAITAVAISPASRLLVTAGRRGKIVVWDAKDRSVVASVGESHNRDQVSGIFFESETQLVSAGYDGKVYRWTISGTELTSQEVQRPDPKTEPQFIVRLRPSPDRTRFATSEVSVSRRGKGSKVGQLNIQIWSADSSRSLEDRPIEVPESDKEVAFRHDISWSGDGGQLLFVQDGQMKVYETANWKLIKRFRLAEPDARPVRGALAPSADGKSLRAATFDGRFTHLWDLTDGSHLAEFRSHAMYSVVASFSPDQKYVATASETLRIFDADENSPNHGSTIFRQPTREPHRSPLADVRFNPMDGNRLASVDTDGTIEIWSWSPGEERPLTAIGDSVRAQSDAPEWAVDLRFGNSVFWTNDGESVVVLQKGHLSLLRLKGDPMRVDFEMPAETECRFNQLDLSDDGQMVTAGGVAWSTTDRSLTSFAGVWKLTDQSPKLVATMTNQHSTSARSKSERTGITGRRTGIMAIAFDNRAQQIVTGGADGRLIRWNLSELEEGTVVPLDRIADMREEGTQNAHKASLTAIDVAADGRIVTTDQLGDFILWPSYSE